jgi:indole-3-glycerol phosphate synthase / phosphoribosylanthranilate isomerase
MNNAGAFMPNSLNEIISYKKLEIEKKKITFPLEQLKRTITIGDGSFLEAMQKSGIKIIAEIKPKSPSAGVLNNHLNADEIIRIYDQYACAISVLSEEKFFGGSMELLANVVEKSSLPVLCKDFVLEPYQCYLARHYGAQAILLIVKILTDEELQKLYEQTNELGMTAVLEVQNEAELKRIISLKPAPSIVLINNRNLEDFSIDLNTTKLLAPVVPEQTIIISASGLQSNADIRQLLPFCSVFLVGTLFMQSDNPDKAFKELIETDPTLSGGSNPSLQSIHRNN